MTGHAFDADASIFSGGAANDGAVLPLNGCGLKHFVFFGPGLSRLILFVLGGIRRDTDTGAAFSVRFVLIMFRCIRLPGFRFRSNQSGYPSECSLELGAITSEFRKPEGLPISDYRGLVINAIQIDREYGDLIARRKFRELVDQCAADLFAFQKPARAVIPQIQN